MAKLNIFVTLGIATLAFCLYHYSSALGHVWEAILMPLSGVLGAASVAWTIQLLMASLLTHHRSKKGVE